jgi:hypothetical protein
MAVDGATAVQDVSEPALRERLRAQRAVLELPR